MKNKKMHAVLVLAITAMTASFVLTGCSSGNDETTTMAPDMTTAGMDTTAADPTGMNDNGVVGDVANGVGDVAEGVGDAVGDVAKGVKNGVDEVVNGFDNYNDAHDYLFGKFQNTNANGKYEVRNESKDLMDYNTGKQGYRFEMYDTSSSKENRLGEFYVDSKDGTVHKMNDKTNKVEPYDFTK